MATLQIPRKVYSAEELHRLRGASSQPKLREAIEEHESEDADIVKEHVLRGTKSFTVRSFRSRVSANTLRVPSSKSNDENLSSQDAVQQVDDSNDQPISHVLGEITANGQLLRQGPYRFRPSPTPSMKRKKAEAIVKAHGSPTHVRVTAGGRIVPSEQSPLCHPRYGYSAIKVNGGLIKFAPNHHAGKPQWTQATENGFVAQDVHGNLCQIVNGTILPLNETADGGVKLYIPAPNLSITQRGSSLGPVKPSFQQNGNQASQDGRAASSEPPLAAQITALEQEYTELDHELKDIDKTEVIHGRTMSKTAKDALIAKRRELVTNMDKVRKAVKGLKNQPPSNAPTSPRAMRDSISPQRPSYMRGQQPNNSMALPTATTPFGPYFGGAPQFGSQYGAHFAPSQDDVYASHDWAMPPPGAFVPQPPFDGSMASPFPAYQTGTSAPGQPLSAIIPSTDTQVPRNDGARSSVERHIDSPKRPHAMEIKAPDSKVASGLKSGLNPMSPAYRPAAGIIGQPRNNESDAPKQTQAKISTPLSPLHQLQPAARSQKASNITDDTVNPVKKNTHLQSSSIASFETADFFPRNTHEYSTRQHAYPYTTRKSEDKENADPEHSTSLANYHDMKVGLAKNFEYSPQIGNFRAPAAPLGTPVHPDPSSYRASLQVNIQAAPRYDVPDREANNMSPKSKREWTFIQEHPQQASDSQCSIPDDPCVTSADSIDFSMKPREWIEGYQAGLQRRPVPADCAGDFLDGYCSGLLKSKPLIAAPAATAQSTGSPLKPASRRPSPALPSRTSSRLHIEDKALPPRPRVETSTHSLDTLKQVVFAPQNKNAVLTPAADGFHVNEYSLNLGTWSKTHQAPAAPQGENHAEKLAGYHYPLRTASLACQNVTSESGVASKLEASTKLTDTGRLSETGGNYLHPRGFGGAAGGLNNQAASPTLSTRSIASNSIVSGSAPNPGYRVSSLMSIDSGMQRQYPGSRILNPTDWKSGSSIANAASLATGYFTSGQFDGANQQLQRATSTSCQPPTQPQQPLSRFREGSLDGLSSPPTSPTVVPLSPTLSIHDSPVRDGGRRRLGGKTSSPAKAKFEHIAGKVGIKVSASGKTIEDSIVNSFEPGSPPDKRRWRDMWRKGGKEGAD